MTISSPELTKEERRRIKAENRLRKSGNHSIDRIHQSADENFSDKVTVLCVRYGNRYGKEYVERLRNMVARHSTIDYEFACLTDDQHGIAGVRTIYQPAADYRKLWWHKVHMFDPSLDISGRVLYFDLDVVISSNIDKLVKNYTKEFVGIKDFNRKFHSGYKYLNSSVMTWIHGQESYIYTEFCKSKSTAMRLHGDQDWIWKIARDRISFFPDPWIQSYKWEIRSREQLVSRDGRRGFKTQWDGKPMPECAVAVFHGEPKPQDLPDRYVVDNWK